MKRAKVGPCQFVSFGRWFPHLRFLEIPNMPRNVLRASQRQMLGIVKCPALGNWGRMEMMDTCLFGTSGEDVVRLIKQEEGVFTLPFFSLQ